jgi:hypothetical protein
VNLGAQTAVWAASEEAKFLHGRFFLGTWDVDQLTKGPFRQMIESDDDFLRLGVQGLSRNIMK